MVSVYRVLRTSSVLLLVGFMVACGGGGGGGSSTAVVTPQPPIPAVDYSCDPVKELAALPRTSPFVTSLEFLPQGSELLVTKYERWPLVVDGETNELNIAIMMPAGTPVGVVINGHGQSTEQAALPPSSMVNSYWDKQVASRGYISVTVARRGNYGSTGNMIAFITDLSATSQMKHFKYQSASLVAALNKMSTDPVFQPYMGTILMQGASGGSDTVIQTTADSAVFKAATKKAVIRFDGGVNTVIFTAGTSTVNAGNVYSMNEYAATIAKGGVSSLWVIGDQDTLSHPPQIACQYKYYNQSAGYANTIFVVPGMGHEGSSRLFGPYLRQNFREYMNSRGFSGF